MPTTNQHVTATPNIYLEPVLLVYMNKDFCSH